MINAEMFPVHLVLERKILYKSTIFHTAYPAKGLGEPGAYPRERWAQGG